MTTLLKTALMRYLNKNTVTTLLSGLTLGVAASSHAHVSPVPTRVVYHGGNSFGQVAVINSDPSAYFGLETWTMSSDPINPGQLKKNSENRAFFVSPKFDTVPPGSKQVILHIIPVPDVKLPTKQEKLFYLEFQEAPPLMEMNPKLTKAKKNTAGGLQITIHTQIKLIYRPKGMPEIRNKVLQNQITATRYGHTLIVQNNSPYVVNTIGLYAKKPDDVTSGDRGLETSPTILNPHTKTVMLLNAKQFKTLKSPARTLVHSSLKYINDYGGAVLMPITVTSSHNRVAPELKTAHAKLVNGKVVA